MAGKFPVQFCRGFLSVFLVFVLISITPPALSADPQSPPHVVRVGAYANSPKIFFDEQGEAAGFWPDLLAHIADLENWEIQYVNGSWPECIDHLLAGELDLMPDVAYTEERARQYTFSEATVLLSWSRLYVHQDAPDLHSLRDLEGWTVAALKGSVNLEGPMGLRSMTEGFDLAVKFLELNEYDDVFAAIENGDATAGISNRNFGNLNAGRYKIKKTPLIFQPANLKFALPNGAPATELLKTRIDFHINRMKQDKESVYYQLLVRYFEAEVAEREVEVWPSWLARTLQGVGVLLIMFGAVILVSRRQVRKKTAELELRHTELKTGAARYLEIFNATSDAIFIHDAQTGQILDVNRAMLEMYGTSYEEVLNCEAVEYSSGIAPYTQARAESFLQATITEGPQVFEWMARRKNSEVFWVEVALQFTQIADQDRIIAVVRDIDSRKKALVAVARMEDEVLKAKKLEAVGVLAGGIAHDFNNILSAILGNLELSLEEVGPHHRAAPLLAGAEEAVIRATKLTKQLLTFSRGGDPVREVASLGQIIRESADFVLRGSAVAIDYDLPADLWLVDSDTGQMGQVIQNLVLNARHAMPNGGVVSISCANIPAEQVDSSLGLEPGNAVCVAVRDQGIGIPQDILEKVFDPYFTTKQEGSGLGLAVSHSIVKKHGGHIGAASDPGGGTCFTIHLPATGLTGIPSSQEIGTVAIERSGRILVMDDKEDLRDIYDRMLTRLGFQVESVADGEQALDSYRNAEEVGRPFDLVIMDLTIPGGIGGREAARTILDLYPDARLIVASGYSNDKVMANCRDYGFVGSLAKPVLLAALAKTIDDVLDRQD